MAHQFINQLAEPRKVPRRLWQLACEALLVSLLATRVVAGPYSDLVIFGDSLSDIGNVANLPIISIPGPYYYDGRFSNGPVYSEQLALALGLEPLAASSAGGGDYAYGGAQTTGTGGINGLFIDDVDEQVADFLAQGPADLDALYVVFAGANDLLGGVTDVSGPVASLASDLERLIAANARNFLVMDLPLLGSTPRFNTDPVESAAMTALTIDFNSVLAMALDDLELAQPNATIYRLDVAGLFSDLIANPGTMGFMNVTDPAAPGLAPGDSTYDTDQIVSDPDAYLFWDDLHPTTVAHALLAERAAAAVQLAADFDADGDVDRNDFNIWQTGFGTVASALHRHGDADRDRDVDGADFLFWQQEYHGGSLQTVTVPEPASHLLLLLVLVVVTWAIHLLRTCFAIGKKACVASSVAPSPACGRGLG